MTLPFLPLTLDGADPLAQLPPRPDAGTDAGAGLAVGGHGWCGRCRKAASYGLPCTSCGTVVWRETP